MGIILKTVCNKSDRLGGLKTFFVGLSTSLYLKGFSPFSLGIIIGLIHVNLYFGGHCGK